MAVALSAQAPVKSDCAADGLVVNAVTGEPVPRAHLSVLPSQQSSVADDAGRWSISSIPCGRAQITASRPGFLMGGAGMPRTGAAFEPLRLESGSPAHGVRVQLTPQVVVAGKVVDEAGDPVQNAQVNALISRVVEGRRVFQISSTSLTNDLGEFRIPGLQSGRYIFCARGTSLFSTISTNGVSPGVTLPTSGESCYPGPIDGGDASAMALAAGREARVDFSLREVPAVRVRGTVTGMPKNQGAVLILQRRGANRGMANGRPAILMPDGTFEVRGVTPGSYTLVTDYWDTGGRITAHVPVDVGGSDVEGVAVHLEPALTVTGSLRVESATGKTLPNQRWALSLRAADPESGGVQMMWDKDHAVFTGGNVIPGNYRVEGTPPAPFYLKSATYGGRDLARDEVPITQAGGQMEVVVSDDSGSIEGSVEDSDGQPVQATVMVFPDGRSPRSLQSGADGHFHVPNLAPGDYYVYAWDDASQVEYADADWMKRFGSKGQKVSIQAGQSGTVKVVEQSVR